MQNLKRETIATRSFKDFAKRCGLDVPDLNRPVVCVQGLGFVGAAMAIAVARARDQTGAPCFNVIGVDLATLEGLEKIHAINCGRLPFISNDADLVAALHDASSCGNLVATNDPEAYSLASIIVVDVNLDVKQGKEGPSLGIDSFRKAVRVVGDFMAPGCLVIVETTVAPGTCEKVVIPELKQALSLRGLSENAFLLAHSYERVMPGRDYLNSIVNYWRVYAGATSEAAEACKGFLEKVIDVKNYPLTRLASVTASETAKILENSYRATTIAFMEEWGRFAEAIGIDLFEAISAICKRPTHSNMREPGFGVGGYCLTKDPLLAILAARDLFQLPGIEFPFCEMALATNIAMPLKALEKVEKMLGGTIANKSLLLLGVSYRPDIGDTRYSPSEQFVVEARARGAKVTCFDPFVKYWPELDERLPAELPDTNGINGIIFAVRHEQFTHLNIKEWLNSANPAVLDANNVLSKDQREAFRMARCAVVTTGRGDGL